MNNKVDIINNSGFERILVPIDDSSPADNALKTAMFFSKKLKIPLLVVYVVDMNIYAQTMMSNQISNHWRSILRDEGEKLLNNAKKIGSKNAVELQTQLVEGTPSQEIINVANKNDLIMMGSKGKSEFEKIFIGSVSENVLHHAKNSVMIVR